MTDCCLTSSEQSAGGGNRTGQPEQSETLEKRPDRASEAPTESPHLETARDKPQPVEAGPGAEPTTTDDAIRSAAKLAIDAGDMIRARALLDLLDGGAQPTKANVIALAHLRDVARRST